MNKSVTYYSFVYTATYVLALVALFAITYGLFMFAPDLAESIFEGGGGTGASVMTLVMPPMMAAQSFYKHERRRLTRGEGWGMAVLFTVLAFVLSAATFWLSLKLQVLTPRDIADLTSIWNEYQTVFFYVGAAFAVFILLLNKLMLWSAVRGAIKQEEKKAAKDARQG